MKKYREARCLLDGFAQSPQLGRHSHALPLRRALSAMSAGRASPHDELAFFSTPGKKFPKKVLDMEIM